MFLKIKSVGAILRMVFFGFIEPLGFGDFSKKKI
jgi:hypothetical protein